MSRYLVTFIERTITRGTVEIEAETEKDASIIAHQALNYNIDDDGPPPMEIESLIDSIEYESVDKQVEVETVLDVYQDWNDVV